jgi:hypothetical protein
VLRRCGMYNTLQSTPNADSLLVWKQCQCNLSSPSFSSSTRASFPASHAFADRGYLSKPIGISCCQLSRSRPGVANQAFLIVIDLTNVRRVISTAVAFQYWRLGRRTDRCHVQSMRSSHAKTELCLGRLTKRCCLRTYQKQSHI